MEKTLILNAAFGPSRDQAILLTRHPDESHDQYGFPRADARTLVLSLKGTRATFVEERPVPLFRSWYSTGSGVGYCTSAKSNKLYKWQAGKWSEEAFSDAAVDFVRFIFGLPGEKPEDDQLFMTGDKGLYIRVNNTWKRHKMKDSGSYQIHGRVPTEVYVASDPPLRWDGKKVTPIEGPEDGEVLNAVWVTSDDLLVGGNYSMYLTTPKGTWKELAAPTAGYGNLVEYDGILYASTDKGVAQVRPPLRKLVGPKVDLTSLTNVGDGLLAIGREMSLVFDGKSWKEITLPSCAEGKRPK